MQQFINSNDINLFGGQFKNRNNSYDDKNEVSKFIKFAETCNDNYFFRPKPFGKYGVDVGMYTKENELIAIVDIERWRAWNEEWPNYYRYLSFVERKEKYLRHKQDFALAVFNASLTKLVMVTKENILLYPPVAKYFKNHGKYDYVRQIPFEFGKLYGANLTDKEKRLFKNHYERELY